MIISDTNVVSEMMRDDPDQNVLTWSETVGRLHTTAISLAQVNYGIARLPEGHRKDRLAATAASVFVDYDELIVAFDAHAARRYGSIVAEREKAGRPITTTDAEIAAICATHEATLATRNTSDFEGTGIELVNPWDG